MNSIIPTNFNVDVSLSTQAIVYITLIGTGLIILARIRI